MADNNLNIINLEDDMDFLQDNGNEIDLMDLVGDDLFDDEDALLLEVDTAFNISNEIVIEDAEISEEDEIDYVDQVLDYIREENKRIECLEIAANKYYAGVMKSRFSKKLINELEEGKSTKRGNISLDNITKINSALATAVSRNTQIDMLLHVCQSIDKSISRELMSILNQANVSLKAEDVELYDKGNPTADMWANEIITELKKLQAMLKVSLTVPDLDMETAQLKYLETLNRKRFRKNHTRDIEDYSAIYTISYINLVSDPLVKTDTRYYEVKAYRARLDLKGKETVWSEDLIDQKYPKEMTITLPLEPKNQMQILNIRKSELYQLYLAELKSKGFQPNQNMREILLPLVLRDNGMLFIPQDISIYEEFKSDSHNKSLIQSGTTDEFLLTGITASPAILPSLYFKVDVERDIPINRYTNDELLDKIKTIKTRRLLSKLSTSNALGGINLEEAKGEHELCKAKFFRGELSEEDFKKSEAKLNVILSGNGGPKEIHKHHTQLRDIFLNVLSPYITLSGHLDTDTVEKVFNENKKEIVTQYINASIPYIKHQSKYLYTQIVVTIGKPGEEKEGKSKSYSIKKMDTLDVLTMAKFYNKHLKAYNDVTEWASIDPEFKDVIIQDILGEETEISEEMKSKGKDKNLTNKSKLFEGFYRALEDVNSIDFGEGIISKGGKVVNSEFFRYEEPLLIDTNNNYMVNYVNIPRDIIKNLLAEKLQRSVDINMILNSYLKTFIVDNSAEDTFFFQRAPIENNTINPHDTEVIKLCKQLCELELEGKLTKGPSQYLLKHLGIVDTGVIIEDEIEDYDCQDIESYKIQNKAVLETEGYKTLCFDIDRFIKATHALPYLPKVIKSLISLNYENISEYKTGESLFINAGLPNKTQNTLEFPLVDYIETKSEPYSYHFVLDTLLKGGYESPVIRDITALSRVLSDYLINRINNAKDDDKVRSLVEKAFKLNLFSNQEITVLQIEDSPVPIEAIKTHVQDVLNLIKPGNIDYFLMLNDIRNKSTSINKSYIEGIVNNIYKNYLSPNKDEVLSKMVNLRMLRTWLSLFGPLIPPKYSRAVDEAIEREDIEVRKKLKVSVDTVDSSLESKKGISEAAYIMYLKTGESKYLSNVDMNYVRVEYLTQDSPGYKAKGHFCKENIIKEYNLESYDEEIDPTYTVADLIQLAEKYDKNLYYNLPLPIIQEVESPIRVVSKEVVAALKTDTKFKIKYEVVD